MKIDWLKWLSWLLLLAFCVCFWLAIAGAVHAQTIPKGALDVTVDRAAVMAKVRTDPPVKIYGQTFRVAIFVIDGIKWRVVSDAKMDEITQTDARAEAAVNTELKICRLSDIPFITLPEVK